MMLVFTRVPRGMLAALLGLSLSGALAYFGPARAQDAFDQDQAPSASDAFYDQLADYGTWVDHWKYGRVWYPSDVDEDWRPYSHGHWVLTEDYGWYWESADRWGWATDHYGRWAFDDEYGWIWVPGRDWGPAWVDWRRGDDYVGWAPLPPEAIWQDGQVSYPQDYLREHGDHDYRPHDHEHGRDDHQGFVAEHDRALWCFVPVAGFLAVDVARHLVPASRNLSIINTTTRATNYKVENGRVVNRSIDVGRIAEATHTQIQPVRSQSVSQPHVGSVGGNAHPNSGAGGAAPVAIYRPQLSAVAPPASGRPVVPKLSRGGLAAPVQPAVGAVAPQGPPVAARPAASTPVVNPAAAAQLQALQQKQAQALAQQQQQHAQEKAAAAAAANASANAAALAQRHQAEQVELQRIQQTQRAVVQNRAAVAPVAAQPRAAPVNQPPQKPAQPHPPGSPPPGQPPAH